MTNVVNKVSSCNNRGLLLVHVKAFCHDSSPISISISKVIVYKTSFMSSYYVFRVQKWFNLTRDDVLHLHDLSC
jgi:hypothetical protein